MDLATEIAILAIEYRKELGINPGEAIMKSLEILKPDLHNCLSGSTYDCSKDDTIIPKFWRYIWSSIKTEKI